VADAEHRHLGDPVERVEDLLDLAAGDVSPPVLIMSFFRSTTDS